MIKLKVSVDIEPLQNRFSLKRIAL